MCDGLLLAVFSRGKDREGGLASDRQTEPLHLTIFSPPSRALAHTHASWHTHTHTHAHRGTEDLDLSQWPSSVGQVQCGSAEFSSFCPCCPCCPLSFSFRPVLVLIFSRACVCVCLLFRCFVFFFLYFWGKRKVCILNISTSEMERCSARRTVNV